ncbi:uncharacterized protein LOC110882755 [Helianthus annuus]|uniref:uncharacterized protein LOC110882755 n=1 Tax=Helianthus annuus TaxID=4232 RepID=UPI000B8EF5F0|nr:uncharacterized protein LOC110882755 [Helianthus annuus]
MRSDLRNHIWTKIGNGKSTSAWYDYWCDSGPLCNFLTSRVITRAGFNLEDTVEDIYGDGSWNWLVAWRDLYPVLNQVDLVQCNLDVTDRVFWKEGNDLSDLSSSSVWKSVRTREVDVDWFTIVWFSQCIPRHAFLMWLIMQGKLLAPDKISQWDFARRKNMNMICCLLYYADVDSHAHLFFECNFSAQVWNSVRSKAGMAYVDSKWSSIVDLLCARARSKSAINYVSRVIVAATTYMIWQERNARLFKNHSRPPDTLCDIILSMVRYKLMGMKFKDTDKVRRLLVDWGIHGDSVIDNGG